jgi:hypothetical protein
LFPLFLDRGGALALQLRHPVAQGPQLSGDGNDALAEVSVQPALAADLLGLLD